MRPLGGGGGGADRREGHRGGPKGERRVWIPAEQTFRSVPVWDRYGLPPGWCMAGPAVIEEIESTTVVLPAFDVAVDDGLNLVLTRRLA